MSAPDQGRAAERAAFVAGSEWRWHTAVSVASAEAEAARRYPDAASAVPAPAAVPLHLRPVTQEWMAGEGTTR